MGYWSLMLTCSLIAGASIPLPQANATTKRPTFAGTWRPSDPPRSDRFFEVGLGLVPGDGRVVIEQSSNRLTLTKNIPDATLDRLLAIQREFYTTTVYRIDEAPIPGSRPGGAGASGLTAGASPSSWQGDRLVFIQRQLDSRKITASLSLDGDRLKLESHTVILREKTESTVSEWFDRIK
jgi:hypothetical protein